MDRINLDLYTNQQPLIKELKPGQGGYVVPWMMDVNSLGECRIHGLVRIQPRKHGTRSLYVFRTVDDKLAVNVREVEYVWEVTGDKYGEFMDVEVIVQ